MGMKSEEESVALQAIEFWTSVAEEEAQLEADYQDAQEVLYVLLRAGSC
jgi:importin subunit beta-1